MASPSLSKAVGTGLAGPAAVGSIFGQPTRAKNAVDELRRVQFLLQEQTSVIDRVYGASYNGGDNNKERRQQCLVLERNCCN